MKIKIVPLFQSFDTHILNLKHRALPHAILLMLFQSYNETMKNETQNLHVLYLILFQYKYFGATHLLNWVQKWIVILLNVNF